MAEKVMADRTTTVTAMTTASAEWTTNVTSARTDVYQVDTTITTDLADALLERVRTVGAVIEMDNGTGGLVEISRSNLGESIQISKSLDGYSDSLTFTLVGEGYAPLANNLLRTRKRVRVTGYLGYPGATATRTLFDGYTNGVTFQVHPAQAQVRCIDYGTLHAEKEINLAIAPGSRRTRLDILINDILEANSVPYGEIDLGTEDGGIVVKTVSTSGQRMFDFVKQFLAPTGVTIRFDSREFTAKRIRPKAVADRTISSSEFAPQLSIEPPDGTSRNLITVSGITFQYLGPTGLRTVWEESIVTGTYTPKVGVNKQDKTTGNVTAHTRATSEVTEISRVRTRSMYNGGTLYNQYREEWGWYAPVAARYEQDNAGTVTHNTAIDVYQFEDGTWRSQDVESYQVVRRTNLQRTFDSSEGHLTTEEFFEFSFVNEGAAWGRVAVDGTTENYVDCYLLSGHSPVLRSCEILAHSQYWKRTYNFDAEYLLTSVVQDISEFAAPVVAKAADVYIYGTRVNKTYRNSNYAFESLIVTELAGGTWNGKRRLSTTYTPVSEERYLQTEETREFGLYIDGGPDRIFSRSFEVQGRRPMAEQATSRQIAQETRATVRNEPHIAAYSENVYQTQDEWCETHGELQIEAFDIAREYGATAISFTIPADFDLVPGSTVVLTDIPDMGLEGEYLLVHDVQLSMNLFTGETQQQMTALWWPPELRN